MRKQDQCTSAQSRTQSKSCVISRHPKVAAIWSTDFLSRASTDERGHFFRDMCAKTSANCLMSIFTTQSTTCCSIELASGRGARNCFPSYLARMNFSFSLLLEDGPGFVLAFKWYSQILLAAVLPSSSITLAWLELKSKRMFTKRKIECKRSHLRPNIKGQGSNFGDVRPEISMNATTFNANESA